MPMPMTPPHMDNFASGSPEEDEDEDPNSKEAMMEELDKAAGAGDEFAAKEFFKTPEGVQAPDAQTDTPQLTPEMLMQLMELLKQKQAGGDGGAMPPPMPNSMG